MSRVVKNRRICSFCYMNILFLYIWNMVNKIDICIIVMTIKMWMIWTDLECCLFYLEKVKKKVWKLFA